MEYRRVFRPGGTFFFTVVTFDRIRILNTPVSRQLLREVIEGCRRQWPFEIDGIVLLPDHLHTVWTLPEGDAGYSQRWGWIKKTFTQRWLESGGIEKPVSDGKLKDGRRGVWQPKFYEHTIRDPDDFNKHLDYIHYNPVKHELAKCPHQWEWSSFHRWAKADGYAQDWQCVCNGPTSQKPDFQGLALAQME